MIDVYRKQPIDEKSDIWALGVLLYKLCYYTTPFEDQGQLAILNASYKFPSYPAFSDRLKGLIAWMLRENQQSRPNIYQVLCEACAMAGREPPVKDVSLVWNRDVCCYRADGIVSRYTRGRHSQTLTTINNPCLNKQPSHRPWSALSSPQSQLKNNQLFLKLSA